MRFSVLAALVGAAALAAAVPVGAPAAQTARGKPQLSAVVGIGPLTVRGWRFAPRERVKVTATIGAGSQQVRRPVADRRGRFLVRFSLRIPRCATVLLRARGTNGSRVAYQLPRPDCREP